MLRLLLLRAVALPCNTSHRLCCRGVRTPPARPVPPAGCVRRHTRLALAAAAHDAPVAPPAAVDEWEGLRGWRTAGVNENCRCVSAQGLRPRVAAADGCARRWGEKGPAPGAAPGAERYAAVALPTTLAECGRLVLLTPAPEARAHAAARR